MSDIVYLFGTVNLEYYLEIIKKKEKTKKNN